MSIIQGQSHIGPDGKLNVPLPPGYEGTDVRFTLDVRPISNGATNGQPSGRHPPKSKEEWRAFVRSLAGRLDDPTFVRHPQGEFEKREPLD